MMVGEDSQVSRKELQRVFIYGLTCIFTLYLPLMWFDFYDQNWNYEFPFYDIKLNKPSLNPTEKLKVSSEWFITYLSKTIRPLVYAYVIYMRPNTRIQNIFGNIALYQIIFELCLMLDFLIAFEQSPFRAYFALILSMVIINYLGVVTRCYLQSES